MTFWEQMKNSTIAWIVLSLIAILSLVWGIYSHCSNNKKKRLSVAFSSYKIVKEGKGGIPNFEILYLGKQISNLTISKFAIWNSGNKIINSNDIVSTEKLEIFADDGEEILDAQIVTETEPANLFKISSCTEKSVCIDFDYVDSHEGIIVQVLHTGKKEHNLLSTKCKIKGGLPIKYYSPAMPKSKRRRLFNRHLKITGSMLRKITACMMLVDAILICIMSLVMVYIMALPKSQIVVADPAEVSIGVRFILIGLLVIANMLLITISIERIKIVFTIGVPSKLKMYTVYSDEAHNN